MNYYLHTYKYRRKAMDQFLKEDKQTLAYYIRKYCPNLPYKNEYIETKLKPILDRLVVTDPAELNGLFWPGFNEYYDNLFCKLIEKKGLRVKQYSVDVEEDDEPYDFHEKAAFDYDDIRLVYAVRPGNHTGFLVKEVVDDYEYIRQADIIMDDLYRSSNIDGLSNVEKKKVILHLLRFIDSNRCFVEKTWPSIAIKDELLKNLQTKYDYFDELYDEVSMCLI